MKALIKDIVQSLEMLAEHKRIAFSKTSYPTKLLVIGVTNPNIKIVLKELISQSKTYSSREKIELAKQLIACNIFECQQLAYEFLDNSKNALSDLNAKDIDAMNVNMDNWVLVDYYAALIVGYAWREKIISINKIKQYYSAEDYWQRRIAIVATVALNQKARGGTGDTNQTLAICQLAVADHEKMINKALSWALRVLSQVDKLAVSDFIEQYKNELHKTVLREVKNKLEKGLKN